MISRQQRKAIGRCQNSVAFFLRNFVKTKHTSAGVVPFHPFKYQAKALKAFRNHRFTIFRKCRQSGASKISGAFALWFAMFFNHKTVLIVSRRDEDAITFLSENVAFPFRHLPQWMRELWGPIKDNEHEIQFPNGSKIKSLTSHPDVLRSNSSSLNIIDEAAFIRDMGVMWAAGYPCVRGDTLICTDDGVREMSSVGDINGPRWQNKHFSVATDVGYRECSALYVSGKHHTIKITTYLGFELEGTGHHKIRVISDNGNYSWQQLSSLRPGDITISKPDQYKGRRRYLDDIELTPQFATILGLYIGDGSLSTKRPKRFRIYFDPQDRCTRDLIIERFNTLALGIDTTAYPVEDNTTVSLRLNSASFIAFMCKHKLNSKTCPHDAEIPSLIMQSDREVACAFLRGLFDSDGWCYGSSTSTKLGFSTVSRKLAYQVQVLLISIGIIAKRRIIVNHTNARFGDGPYYKVEIYDDCNKVKYRDLVGFITERKQKALDAIDGCKEYSEINHGELVREFANEVLSVILAGGTFRRCNDNRKWNLYRIRRSGRVKIGLVKTLTTEFGLNCRLAQYIKNGLYFDTVTDIEEGECETYDLSVPDNNTYLANSLISHNTLQHGGSVIVVSTCVHPDSYIITDRGLQQIKDFAPPAYTAYNDGYHSIDLDAKILSPSGMLAKTTKFYKRDPEPTKRIITASGYELEASTRHRMRTNDGYQYVDNLQIGDYVPIIRGHNIYGHDDYLGFVDTGWENDPDRKHPTYLEVESIDPELAYVLGVITAEGNLADTYVTVTNASDEVKAKFFNNTFGLHWIQEDRETHIRCCSTRFVRFLKWFGFERCRAFQKTVPRRLWSCSKPIIASYLRGLYDGDGHSRTRDGEVGLTSTSRELIQQVRLLLLNMGIICREEYHPAYVKTFNLNDRIYESECRESWQLIVRSGEAGKFYESIGFGIEYKTANAVHCRDSREFIPGAAELICKFRDESGLSRSMMKSLGIHPQILSPRKSRPNKHLLRVTVERFLERVSEYQDLDNYKSLKLLMDPHIYWDEIVSLDDGFAEVMDFTIPVEEAFWTNGFDSHNTNGVGDWYWSTWTDAEAGLNDFHPIMINWWDMDWTISYKDALSGRKKSISPAAGIRKCTTANEIDKYGPYWSPWLEEQYRALQEKGETWKFKQEILADFVGSGNTVLDPRVLSHLTTCIDDEFKTIKGEQPYVHPVKQQHFSINFLGDTGEPRPDEGLWIWRPPNYGSPQQVVGSRIVDPGVPAHRYTMGVDIATGKGRDYFGAEIFDIDEQEQAAELMVHTLPRQFKFMVDYLGRWYNNAMMVVERNNGGDAFIDELRYDLMYPNLWRKKDINDKPSSTIRRQKMQVAAYGFMTTLASKPKLNKLLLDYLRVDETGWKIYSRRLVKQLQIYVRKRDKSGRDTNKTEAEDGPGNFDDLVMSMGLAFVGIHDAIAAGSSGLVPFMPTTELGYAISQEPSVEDKMAGLIERASGADPAFLMPMTGIETVSQDLSILAELQKFTEQVGAIPIAQSLPSVSAQKHGYGK